MRIRRIEVRDFRKLGQVEIADLADGLNVIVGNNEAGKSTLLAALRAALFERHRVGGAAALAMQPYGQSVRPQVSIDFDKDGTTWHLMKAFCQRQEAELSGGGQRWSGDAVEEKLAEMFGFTPPGRGESKPDEHHGVFGLLWVEQGTAHRALRVGAGRGPLAAALEREIGQVTGGERGRFLLAAAEGRRDRFWDKRNNPRGDFKELTAALPRLSEQQSSLEQQLAAHDGKIARLTELYAILERHRNEDSLRKAEGRLVEARALSASVTRFEEALRDAETMVERARLRRDRAATRKAARDRLIADLDRGHAERTGAEQRLHEAKAQSARFDALAGEAARQARLKGEIDRDAALRLQRLERASGRQQAQEAAARLADQLAAAEAADQARRSAEAVADSERLTPADLEKLETLQRTAEQSRLKLEGASVRITLDPDAAQTVRLEGGDASRDHDLILSRDTIIHLEGFGRIGIHPGGGVEPLSRAHEDAGKALAAELMRLGHVDLASARAALRRSAEAHAAIEMQAKSLKALAPKGIEAIRRDIARNALLLGGPDDLALKATPESLEAARRGAATANATFREAEQAEKSAEATAATARQEVAVLAERVSAAAAAYGRTQDALTAERHLAADQTLIDELQRESLATDHAEHAKSAALAAVAEADPEATRLMLERAVGAEAAIRRDIEATDRERRDLDIELAALGQRGLGEELAALIDQIAFEEKRLKAMTLEAEGARLLFETLKAAEREAKDKWLAPVRDRSAPYLRLIQSDSSIVLDDESFEIDQLVRNGVAEPFSGLSVGAREQIAVITRLALADILREAGQEACIVLDDALVNTDEARLDRMHLVLLKAAQQQQVLILTCRERDFMQLGAPIRRM